MRKNPMLAYPVSDKPIDYNQPVFMQPKLDGVRCIIQAEKLPFDMGYEPVAYSRTGKQWKNIDHILFNLKPWFQLNPNVILDGELYNHDYKDNFEQIISMVRKTKPTPEARVVSRKNVQFHCYDIVNKKMKFSTRDNWLQNNLQESYCVHLVATSKVTAEPAAKMTHKINLANGYEGSIVRLDTPYQCKRSHSLRKFKDFSDAEANIVGYEEGKGKRTGTLGKFIMQDDDGNQFGCPPGKGYNYKALKALLHRAQWYVDHKATATFTYFERTKAGSYRHPLYKTLRNYE